MSPLKQLKQAQRKKQRKRLPVQLDIQEYKQPRQATHPSFIPFLYKHLRNFYFCGAKHKLRNSYYYGVRTRIQRIRVADYYDFYPRSFTRLRVMQLRFRARKQIKQRVWSVEQISKYITSLDRSICFYTQEKKIGIYFAHFKMQEVEETMDAKCVELLLQPIPNLKICTMIRTPERELKVIFVTHPFFASGNRGVLEYQHTLQSHLTPSRYSLYRDQEKNLLRTHLGSLIISQTGQIDVLLLSGYTQKEIFSASCATVSKIKKYFNVLRKRGFIITQEGLQNPPPIPAYRPMYAQIHEETQKINKEIEETRERIFQLQTKQTTNN